MCLPHEIWLREIRKFGPEAEGPQDIALARFELAFLRVLEMAGLRLDEEAVDDRAGDGQRGGVRTNGIRTARTVSDDEADGDAGAAAGV